jgi:hypothetical protein
MIPITLYLICLLAVLFCAGSVAARLFRFVAIGEWSGTSIGEHFEDRLCLGLIFFTALVSVASLISPLNLTVLAVLAVPVTALGLPDAIGFVRGEKANRSPKRNWILIAAAVCWLAGMIFIATDSAKHYDTGLYHAQMVKWNHQFGVVPGLANLHGRLGFNSAWDIFGAISDQGYFSGRAFHLVSLVIGLIFLAASLRGFHRWVAGDRSFGTILRAFGLVELLYNYRDLLPSLSNDWPGALFVYYALVLTVEILERRSEVIAGLSNKVIQQAGLLAAICFFAITVKLSTMPILIGLVTVFFFTANKIQIGRLMVIVASVVVLPFVARNIVLSGYVLYPVAAVDLFNVSWKVPRADVEFMRRVLKFWALNPVIDWYRAMDMTWSERLQNWYHLRRDEILPVVPWLCLGFASWAIANLTMSRRKSLTWPNNTICTIALLGIVYCFFAAPDPRFAMPWIMAFALAPAACLTHVLLTGKLGRVETCRWIGQIALIVVTAYMLRYAGLKRFAHEPVATLWRLSNLPSSEMRSVATDNGFQVDTVVNGNQAWNADLPNTPELNPSLGLRGHDLKHGFVVAKPLVAELHLPIR